MADPARLSVAARFHAVRHPQYAGFVLVMFGFLLQWPTLLTLAMFPVLVWIYARLAIGEEREMERQFGELWKIYAANTPRFIPKPRALPEGTVKEIRSSDNDREPERPKSGLTTTQHSHKTGESL
ncbi:MAG: isoprenylcysteine carboxylmethyltransferase family protein [Wenzhouxiangellaceae bacterium]|nr:isoprenylcysteine carboxylmethyltransferase family protein [Wenzhouxiangellaceae bacterium]